MAGLDMARNCIPHTSLFAGILHADVSARRFVDTSTKMSCHELEAYRL